MRIDALLVPRQLALRHLLKRRRVAKQLLHPALQCSDGKHVSLNKHTSLTPRRMAMSNDEYARAIGSRSTTMNFIFWSGNASRMRCMASRLYM